MQRPEISVVIPVYGSEKIVPRLCRTLRDALDSYAFEVVLVNDRSPDDSWIAIQRETGQDKRFVGINLRHNVGQDRAIMAGLTHASGDYIVVMDDDLQHQPTDIPALREEIRKGFDVCYANFFRKKQAPIKNFYSWIAGKFAEVALRKPPHVYMSPFKVMRRDVVTEILKYTGPFPYVDGLLFQITDNISQITVEHHRRHSGETTHNFWKQAEVFLNLMTNFSVLPLRLVTLTGCVASAMAFFLSVYFLIVYMTRGIEVYGWTPIVLLILFFGGLILISLGIIGEYLGRVLMNVNRMPQFVVEARINYEGHCEGAAAGRRTQEFVDESADTPRR